MKGIYGYYDKEKRYVVYIGQDSNIDINNRHKAHFKPSNYNNQQINRVLQNNPNRYDYFILAEGNFSEDELNSMEKQAIEIFKTFKYDYSERSVFNFTRGGDGVCGYKHSEETKRKMRENQPDRSGKNHPMYSKRHSEETKRKISENHADVSGKNHPFYGKKHSEETKRKMSKAQSGENNPNYGKKRSEETRKKISKNNWMRNRTGKNNPRYKDYARIIKMGIEPYSKKQNYAIKKDGKIIKQSINKEKLKEWFKKEYTGKKLYDSISKES